jgi:hypothetical protein
MSIFTNMRVAINLCGISYGDRGRDWRRGYENINKNLIYTFENPNIYITTYHNETQEELIDKYKPKKHQLIQYSNSDLRTTYKKSLESMIEEDIDLIVSTRFDILFNDSISNYNIDPEKFNFFFREKGWWDNHRYTADPQYFSVFPKKYSLPLIESVQDVYEKPHRLDCPDLHPTYSRLAPKIGEENIHFIYDVEALSHDNEYVKLDRNTR